MPGTHALTTPRHQGADEADRSSGPRSRRGRRLPSRRPQSARRRPLRLRLWWGRYRHLLAAACLAAAVLVALSVLAPPPPSGVSVLVVSRAVEAGEELGTGSVERATLPQRAVPASGLADETVLGQRAAIRLEKGTVLTRTMTSGDAAARLAETERLVEVPVQIGAELATPGTRVDIVAVGPDSFGSEGSAQVVGRGARVLSTRSQTRGGPWDAETSITYITIAVPQQTASLVVGAASHNQLGIMLSP